MSNGMSNTVLLFGVNRKALIVPQDTDIQIIPPSKVISFVSKHIKLLDLIELGKKNLAAEPENAVEYLIFRHCTIEAVCSICGLCFGKVLAMYFPGIKGLSFNNSLTEEFFYGAEIYQFCLHRYIEFQSGASTSIPLKRLEIISTMELKMYHIGCFMPLFPYLRELTISGAYITDELLNLVGYCVQIRHLTLVCKRPHKSIYTENGVQKLLYRLPVLHTIKIDTSLPHENNTNLANGINDPAGDPGLLDTSKVLPRKCRCYFTNEKGETYYDDEIHSDKVEPDITASFFIVPFEPLYPERLFGKILRGRLSFFTFEYLAISRLKKDGFALQQLISISQYPLLNKLGVCEGIYGIAKDDDAEALDSDKWETPGIIISTSETARRLRYQMCLELKKSIEKTKKCLKYWGTECVKKSIQFENEYQSCF